MVLPKKTLLGSLLFSLASSSLLLTTPVQAYNPDPPVAQGDFNVVDVAGWDQMGFNGTPPTSPKMEGFVWSDGCMTMSYATFMRKSGQRDKNWGPDKAYEELKDQGAYPAISPQFAMGAYVDGTKWGDWTLEGFENGNFDALKKAWDDGYGIVCWVIMPTGGAHVFTVDYIEGDKLYHLDTGRSGTDIDAPGQWGKGSITGFYKLKSSDGTKASDLPRLNDVRDGSNSATHSSGYGEGSVSFKGVDESLLDEEELVGMTKRNYRLYEYQLPIVFPGDKEAGTGLTPLDENSLASLKDDVKNNEFNFISFLRNVVSFVGIAFAVYGVLLLVAFMFDASNIFFELSLLGLLTFGRYGYRAVGMPKEVDKKKLLNGGGIARLVISTEVIAWILYSGTAYQLLGYVVDFVKKLMEGGFW